MSISSEITRIQNKRDQSFTEVANKGVTVPAGSTIDDLPGLIAQIEQGSSSGSGGIIYQDLDGYLNLSEDAANVISIVDTLDTAGGTVRTITGAVESGGGGESREDLTVPKDVDFIDFDGRLLYSYTASEFLELTELPPNPSYPGLTAQGWNWTLADAKEFVVEYGAQVIGQNYVTDDGKTRLYVIVTGSDKGPAQIKFQQSVDNGVSVDWGDDTTPESFTGTGLTTRIHTYSTDGFYTITLSVTSGTLKLLGTWNSTCMGEHTYNCATLLKVECGSNLIQLADSVFMNQSMLKSVSISESVTSINGNSLFAGTPVPAVVVPKTCTTFGGTYILNDGMISRVSFPNSITSANAYIGQPVRLHKCVMHPKVVLWGAVFQNAFELRKVIMPEGVGTSIGGNAFLNCFKLTELTIPTTITEIGGAFGGCVSLKELHMKADIPPTLTGTHFSQVASDFKIYVPYSADHSILTAYQEATNWSTYASQMQEEPQ